jgi:hypothetical protein
MEPKLKESPELPLMLNDKSDKLEVQGNQVKIGGVVM